ncbi:hypothetical protein [Ensifer sp. ENS11]|uniref:hypothetical protein n=1 Tax=Ensifer sp. ENS11 TaxID=2769291 RepID=UPI00177D850E|nr:hypothetical protein [Ensifer sp. ENS11]MBD9491541.1 hypothetical protein [Ensifer sp. ENS11]MDP9635077.1 hypothetical protein [Ensifer adhaerens]
MIGENNPRSGSNSTTGQKAHALLLNLEGMKAKVGCATLSREAKFMGGSFAFQANLGGCLGLLTGAILGYLTGFGAGMGMAGLGPELVGLIGAIAGGVGSVVAIGCFEQE